MYKGARSVPTLGVFVDSAPRGAHLLYLSAQPSALGSRCAQVAASSIAKEKRRLVNNDIMAN